MTDVESEVAVYLLAEKLGVPCCPATRTDKKPFFQRSCMTFQRNRAFPLYDNGHSLFYEGTEEMGHQTPKNVEITTKKIPTCRQGIIHTLSKIGGYPASASAFHSTMA